ncbi:STAS domain-containing protein [Scytonema sp. NUACC26]|uniref:STAS domain-containing protein n=1 Tax=Scytonema sp. NUACC26 TaxID=3140176 RepID=UPI0034DBB173
MENTLVNLTITTTQPQHSLNAIDALDFERELTIALSHDYCSTLLVDLEQVESIDSAGLMALVSGVKLAQRLGKCLRICSVSPQLKIIFEMTQLPRVFEMNGRYNEYLQAVK